MKAKMNIVAGMVVLVILAITAYIVPSQIISSANSSAEKESRLDNSSVIAEDREVNYSPQAEITQIAYAAHRNLNHSKPKETAVQAANKQEASAVKEANRRLNEVSAETKEKSDPQASPKTVYLTFDDGPGKHTAEVLDILESYKVPATFLYLENM